MHISMWMHICLFFFSFAVVGFKSSLLNFICASWSYSTYLNCRPGQTYFYLTLLVIGLLEGCYNLLYEENGNIQILGKLINMVVYTIILYIDFKIISGKPSDFAAIQSAVNNFEKEAEQIIGLAKA